MCRSLKSRVSPSITVFQSENISMEKERGERERRENYRPTDPSLSMRLPFRRHVVAVFRRRSYSRLHVFWENWEVRFLYRYINAEYFSDTHKEKIPNTFQSFTHLKLLLVLHLEPTHSFYWHILDSPTPPLVAYRNQNPHEYHTHNN